jgi:hypothetical protein
MDITEEEIIEYIISLRKTVKLFKGDFTILWHNSNLVDQSLRELYVRLIT